MQFVKSCPKSHHHTNLASAHSHIVPLIDGYALDVLAMTFCKLHGKEALELQIANTEMKNYADIITRVNQEPDESFWYKYNVL